MYQLTPLSESDKRRILSPVIRTVTRISDDNEPLARQRPQASDRRASGVEPEDAAGEAAKLGQVGPEHWFYRVKCDGVEIAMWGDIAERSPLREALEAVENPESPFAREVVSVQLGEKERKFAIVGGSRFHKCIIRMPRYCKVLAFPRITGDGTPGSGNATLRVRLGAMFFLRHDLAEVLPFLDDLAAGLGFQLTHLHKGDGTTEAKAHLSRVDVCADLPRRVESRAADCLRGDSQRGQVPWHFRTATGWTGLHNRTSKGVGVRIYDKRREVVEEKQEHYQDAFTRYGLNVYPHIWRVEFSLPRTRLRRGLVRKDAAGEVVDTVSLEKLEDLNAENLDLLWRYLTGEPGQTSGYLWISEQTREEHGHTSSATPCGFWRYVRRCTVGQVKDVGWHAGPRPEAEGHVPHILKCAKGMQSTAIARAGIEEYGGEVDNCLQLLGDAAAEEAPAKFVQLLVKRLGQRLEGRGLSDDAREQFEKQVADGVGNYLSTRASSEFWYRPLLELEDDDPQEEADSMPLPPPAQRSEPAPF